MAAAELAFYERFKPDFLKVMHDVGYEPVEPVLERDDWENLPVLDPQKGNFGLQLETLSDIRAGLNPDVPMIDTVFSVYSYANGLSGGRLLTHLRADPETVHKGLSAIAESLALYAGATIDVGCEGIYYAISGANGDGPTRAEYRDHFLKYDMQVLHASAAAPFNVLHLHGYKDLYYDIALDLPANALCWSDRACDVSLAEGRASYPGCLIGGLDETKFAKMTRDQIVAQARDAISQTRGNSFILAPGCAIPTDTDPALIDLIRESVLDLVAH
jgi:uroporphyrinogen decarboxylase